MRIGVAIAFLLCACTGGDAVPDTAGAADAPLVADAPRDAPPPDARPPDAGLAALTCKQLSDLALPLMDALDRTCNVPEDCEIVNLPAALPSCNGMHILGGNDRAARKGWTDASLTALKAEFLSRCDSDPACTSSNNPCIFDWGPPSAVCNGHLCAVMPRSCLGGLPDAAL